MKWIACGLTAVCVACFLSGCDFDPLGEKGEERKREANERAQEAKSQRELEAQRDAMTKFANGKRQFFKARLSEVSEEKSVLRADLDKFTKVVSNAMSENDEHGKERKYESKVLRILKNSEVNALATKHLASDFSSVVATYIERVREARAADAKYTAAMESTEAIYNAGIEETKNWSKMSHRQREGEIARLQKEIKELENSRERILNEYKNVTRNENSRATTSMRGGGNRYLVASDSRDKNQQRNDAVQVYERRVSDIENQVAVKRNQIDYLRNPEAMNRQANRALDAAQRRQMDAINARRSALSDINRQLKPKKSLVETVAEFEESTIGKLRKTLSDKIAVVEKEEKTLKEKVAMADEILLSIPLYDLGELRRQRQRLEK